MPLARLYAVRHGVTDWNEQGRIQGHTPTSLNESGRAQAGLLARFFAGCPLTAIWSSDLPRARETAERIAGPHGLAVRTLTALRERDLGPFEGMTGDEVEAALKGREPAGGDAAAWYDVPGVEGDEALLARLLPVLEEARALRGEAVLVTHGGIQKALLFHILGIPAAVRRGFALGNGLVVSLLPRDGGWRLEGLHGLETIGRFLDAAGRPEAEENPCR